MKKRYAIITDIHGNKEALESILDDIKKQNIDETYCLGDTIGIGPESKECIDILIKNKIKSILGNHELYTLRGNQIEELEQNEIDHNNWVSSTLTKKELDYISASPLFYEINIDYDNKIPNNKIVLCHYLIKDKNKDYPFEKSKLNKEVDLWKKYYDPNITYVVGHLHKLIDINSVPGIKGDIILDTGTLTNIEVIPSSGCSKDEYVYYMIIEISKSIKYELVKVKYDREKFMKKLDIINYPDKDNILEIFFK